ncbi:MAG: periplasmic heavy metal sensor [Alphaproteobacteria bacterium]|nr:periplasmic heavy metal sensor [Alphaproteobacteria bacterium]
MNTGVKVLLTVSLLLNVLLLGLACGHVYKKWHDHPWQKTRAELSPEARSLIGRTFQATFRDIRPLGDEARKARADMVKILSADEFDGTAFDEAAARLRAVGAQIKDKKIEATKQIASELSAEERRKMAERMTSMIGGGYEKRVYRHRNPEKMERDDEHRERD